LVTAADDPVVAVRETVVMRLRYFSDDRAVAAMRRALSDDDADVRSAAEYGLRPLNR
jgi:HEAT repeat protein